ncbi:MAG: IS3 family transposase [Pedobacter sp.]
MKRSVSQRAQHKATVAEAVEQTYRQFKKRYGAPHLAVELSKQGIACSRNHVARLLKERGLRARNGRGFRHYPRAEAMTNVNANVLNRDFTESAPNVKWVSDITYIKVSP